LEPHDGVATVKTIVAQAKIAGAAAMPKGCGTFFGANAFQSNVPPHLVQRWLGHASNWSR
jgi:hypothetical protein